MERQISNSNDNDNNNNVIITVDGVALESVDFGHPEYVKNRAYSCSSETRGHRTKSCPSSGSEIAPRMRPAMAASILTAAFFGIFPCFMWASQGSSVGSHPSRSFLHK